SAVTKVLKARNVTSDSSLQPVDLLIGGVIDGKLQMVRSEVSGVFIAVVFSVPGSTRRIAYPASRGYSGSDPNRGVEQLGFSDAANRFRQIFSAWKTGDNATVSTRLVAIEASDTADSRFVGAPISTIVIDKHGARWIERGACDWIPTKR